MIDADKDTYNPEFTIYQLQYLSSEQTQTIKNTILLLKSHIMNSDEVQISYTCDASKSRITLTEIIAKYEFILKLNYTQASEPKLIGDQEFYYAGQDINLPFVRHYEWLQENNVQMIFNESYYLAFEFVSTYLDKFDIMSLIMTSRGCAEYISNLDHVKNVLKHNVYIDYGDYLVMRRHDNSRTYVVCKYNNPAYCHFACIYCKSRNNMTNKIGCNECKTRYYRPKIQPYLKLNQTLDRLKNQMCTQDEKLDDIAFRLIPDYNVKHLSHLMRDTHPSCILSPNRIISQNIITFSHYWKLARKSMNIAIRNNITSKTECDDQNCVITDPEHLAYYSHHNMNMTTDEL